MHFNSYHVAVFACSRETEKKRYQLLSVAHATETIQGKGTGASREELKLVSTFRSEESKVSTISGSVHSGGRSEAIVEEFKAKNFLMVYGSKQGKVVARNANMVKNLLHHLHTKRDKATLSVEFPTVLYQLKSDDENIELSSSATIQTLRLFHKDSLHKHYFARTAARAIGVVFINGRSRDLEYKPYGVTIEAELASTM